VIKLEATTGDKMRRVERTFAACQRGKRGVALDLRSPATRPALEALVKWADVVHHNLRMPAARKLGIDYESLRRSNPTSSIAIPAPTVPRVNGPTGPATTSSSRRRRDGGARWGEGNDPMWFRFGFMDHLCAMGSIVATLLASTIGTGPASDSS